MIRLLIAEDSATVRKHLTSLFSREPDFEVVGTVGSADEVASAVERYQPDALSLDVYMPGRAAVEVVREVLSTRPLPIILVSDAPRHDAEVFEALSAGALDFVGKPLASDDEACRELVHLFRALSRVRVRVRRRKAAQPAPPRPSEIRLVTIVSSTGGPTALRELLASLGSGFSVPVVVAQHLAVGFEEGLARWLAQATSLRIRVAQSGDSLEPGEVLLGQAGNDLVIEPTGRVRIARPEERGYHPSGDVLFSSAASAYGSGVLGAVLSGIGSDGAKGAASIAAAGGILMAQDDQSSAVYGMPKAVAHLALFIGSPAKMAASIVEAVSSRGAPRAR
ncbi:MAG: chemotaxis protein CheB [Myxococcota bacterium]